MGYIIIQIQVTRQNGIHFIELIIYREGIGHIYDICRQNSSRWSIKTMIQVIEPKIWTTLYIDIVSSGETHNI